MIKDSSGDFIYFQDLLLKIKEISDCRVFQGHEKLAAVSLFTGADGLVPALGKIASAVYMLNYIRKEMTEGNYNQAFDIQTKIGDFLKSIIMGRCIVLLKRV